MYDIFSNDRKEEKAKEGEKNSNWISFFFPPTSQFSTVYVQKR